MALTCTLQKKSQRKFESAYSIDRSESRNLSKVELAKIWKRKLRALDEHYWKRQIRDDE